MLVLESMSTVPPDLQYKILGFNNMLGCHYHFVEIFSSSSGKMIVDRNCLFTLGTVLILQYVLMHLMHILFSKVVC